MTNTTSTEYVVSSCPDHGTIVATDLASLNFYVTVALGCAAEADLDPMGHAREHVADGTDCWTCCDQQVIDPAEMARG